MNKQGKLHPLSQTIRTINKIFVGMGFEIADGPHIEDQWYNFDALNVPKDHPARDMQDTFFIRSKEEGVEPKVRGWRYSVLEWYIHRY
jgi:phenylalanyl-tRNA synthetase alpha subunit